MNNKELTLGIVIVVLAAVVASYFYFVQNKKVVDCGTDISCFDSNFKTCTPAKFYGSNIVIKGGTINDCEIYAERESFADPKIINSMTCRVDISDNEKFVNANRKDIPFSSGLYLAAKKGSCNGSLSDEIEKAMPKQ